MGAGTHSNQQRHRHSQATCAHQNKIDPNISQRYERILTIAILIKIGADVLQMSRFSVEADVG
jgi:transcription termination factor NusB